MAPRGKTSSSAAILGHCEAAGRDSQGGCCRAQSGSSRNGAAGVAAQTLHYGLPIRPGHAWPGHHGSSSFPRGGSPPDDDMCLTQAQVRAPHSSVPSAAPCTRTPIGQSAAAFCRPAGTVFSTVEHCGALHCEVQHTLHLLAGIHCMSWRLTLRVQAERLCRTDCCTAAACHPSWLLTFRPAHPLPQTGACS